MSSSLSLIRYGSIHPQGWVPIETRPRRPYRCWDRTGSIHPQGWVPIETCISAASIRICSGSGSIHPQGWVPIETYIVRQPCSSTKIGSIHPQGWVPIETVCLVIPHGDGSIGSIHPQGWVPIETGRILRAGLEKFGLVAFTPKGGCPLKRKQIEAHRHLLFPVAFTPKGGCPLKLPRIADAVAYLES